MGPDHHDRSSGVRLLIATKGSDAAWVTIGDALDIALCYGWIDSQRKGHDADHSLQRSSPTTAKIRAGRLEEAIAEPERT